MSKCDINQPMDEAVVTHNDTRKAQISIKRDITKDAIKDPDFVAKTDRQKKSYINDMFESVLEEVGLPELVNDRSKGSDVYRTNATNDKVPETSIEVYDIEKTKDGGYKVLYVTPKTEVAKIIEISKDGKHGASQYNVQNLDDAYNRISKRKIVPAKSKKKTAKSEPVQQTMTFNSDSGANINFNKKNSTVINAELMNDMTKTQEIFDDLVEIDGKDLSAEDKKFIDKALNDLIGSVKTVLPEMIQVLNFDQKENIGEIILDGDKKGIYIGVSQGSLIAGNQMTAAETYVHELWHAALEYALKDKLNKITEPVNDIKKIYKEFTEKATYEIFMPEIGSGNRTLEMKIAKDRLKYLKNPVTGFNEFLVYFKTNKNVHDFVRDNIVVGKTEYASKTAWDKFMKMINQIYNFISFFKRGSVVNLDGATAMNKLINEIHNVNNIAISGIEHHNRYMESMTKIFDTLNNALKKPLMWSLDKIRHTYGDDLAKELNKLAGEFNKDKGNNKLGKIGATAKFLKNVAEMATSDKIHAVGGFETWMEMIGLALHNPFSKETQEAIKEGKNEDFGSFKPEGDVQQILRAFRNSDGYETIIERLGLNSQRVEDFLDQALKAQYSILTSLFDNKLTEQQSESITQGVLDIDMQSLLSDQFGTDHENIQFIESVLSSKKELNAQIGALEKLVHEHFNTKQKANFIINQAKSLGDYMITGKADEGQLTNSYIILGMSNMNDSATVVRNLNNSPDGKYKRALIDRLATLEAIRTNDDKVNQTTLEVIKKYPKQMINVMKQDEMTQRLYKSFEQKTNQYDMSRVKGHHDKIATNYITDKAGFKTQAGEMIKDSYAPSPNLTYNDDFNIYLKSDFTETGYNAEGLIMTNDGQKIFSYLNILKEDMTDIENVFDPEQTKKQQVKIKKILADKENDVKKALLRYQSDNFTKGAGGMRPVLAVGSDNKIFVTDMDISVDRRTLENRNKTRNGFESVMAKTYSRGVGIRYAKAANKKILDAVEVDMNENYLDDRGYFKGGQKNLMTYTKIGPYEDNKLNKEKWPILPRYLKIDIIKRSGNNVKREYRNLAKQITLNQDVDFDDIYTKEILDAEFDLNQLYKDPNADIDVVLEKQKKLNRMFYDQLKKYVNKHKGEIDSKVMQDINSKMSDIKKAKPYLAVRRNMVNHIFGKRSPDLLSHLGIRNTNKVLKALKWVGALWKHLVKMIKTNIVVRDLPVLMWNILSNVLLAVLQGDNPIKEVKQQIKGIMALTEYQRVSKRLSELVIKGQSGTMTKAEEDESKRLQNELEKNSARPLMIKGLYSHAAEDLSNDDLYKQDYFDTWTDEQINKLPSVVKNMLEWGYLMKSNSLFSGLMTFMQASDFGARYSKYYNLIEQGVDPEVAEKKVLDNQINYSWGNSDIVQFLNDNGFAMFTKFLERIQRVIRQTTFDKPFNVLAAAVMGGAMVDDSPLGDFMTPDTISNRFFTPLDLLEVLGEEPAIMQIAKMDF